MTTRMTIGDRASRASEQVQRRPAEGKVGSLAGAVLARLRAQKGWTLADVAAMTGVSISTLSKIENNQTSPAYGVLTRLASGLGIDFVHLIGGSGSQFPNSARVITRAGDGTTFETAMGKYEALASELAAKVFQPMLIEIPVRKTLPERSRSSHNGEEFVFVLSGSVEFLMEPYTSTRLDAGDSVYFDGSMNHGFCAVGPRPAQILSICLSSRSDLESDMRLRAFSEGADTGTDGEQGESRIIGGAEKRK